MRKINSLIALLFLFVAATQWSCSAELFNDCISGRGDEETRVIEIEAIDRFELFGAIDLEIKEGAVQLIEVHSEANLIDRLMEDSFVENGKWRVGINACLNFDDIEIKATIPRLRGVTIEGSGDVKTEGVFQEIDSLELNVDGSGDLKLDLGNEMSFINTVVNGSADFDITGVAEEHSISITGSGDMDSFGLRTKKTDITISGSGDCKVTVEDELIVKISGSGDVCYKGTPAIDQSISGSGEVKSCN